MMEMLRKILARIERAQMIRARYEIRRQLLAMSDRSLADIGVSRELLERGIWPWPEQPAVERVRAQRQPTLAQRRQAIRELRSLSDRELDDLGLSRTGIVDAVNHGRPGIDRDDDRHAA